jgi:integrase/recombinase XerD
MLCRRYYASPTFQRLDASTKNWRRRCLDEICLRHGHKPVNLMAPKHIRLLRDEKAQTPGAARSRLKSMKALFKWATEVGEASHNPTIGVTPIRYVSKSHHTWTEEETAAFQKHYPRGTLARLAHDLLVYTGCRREDVVRLGPHNIQNQRLKYTQAKNEDRKPIEVDIPLHPELLLTLAAAKRANTTSPTFLRTDYGRPFSANGFGNKFKDWCRQADLPLCTAHGLRHLIAVRLAEAGCSPHEIMSVTGHQTLAEVEHYTRKASTALLANAAMAKLTGDHAQITNSCGGEGGLNPEQSVPPKGEWDTGIEKSPTKSAEQKGNGAP